MFNTVQILSSLWLSQIPLDTDLILVVCSLYSLFTLITLAYVTPVLGTCMVFRDNIQIVILRHRKLNKKTIHLCLRMENYTGHLFG